MATRSDALLPGAMPVNIAGAFRFGAVGTTLPAKTSDTFDAGLKLGGLISPDGLTENLEAEPQVEYAWGKAPIAVLLPEHAYSFSFTLYEIMNRDVQELLHGADNVTVDEDGEIHTEIKPELAPEVAAVFQMHSKGKGVQVISVPRAQVVWSGEVTYSDEGIPGYPVTVTALDTGDGSAKATKHLRPTVTTG